MLPRPIGVKLANAALGGPPMEPALILRYARRVKRGPRIELPSARDDELPWRSLIATSVACMAAGLSIAYALVDRGDAQPATSEPTHEPIEHAALPEPAPEHAAVPDLPDASLSAASSAANDPLPLAPDAAVERVAAIPAAPDAAIAEAAPPPPPPPPPPAASAPAPVPDPPAVEPAPAKPRPRLRIEPGLFVYLRCDGLPKGRGPHPCPRDRELETRMREIVQTLPNCREAHAISYGAFDVRIELGPNGKVRDLLVRAPDEPSERAVRACAAPALRKQRTELQPTRMLLSMRFKAR